MMISGSTLIRRMAICAGILFAAPIALDPGMEAARAAEAKPLGVVELFTSQGCNSCPPADAVLATLAKQNDLVALGYHIDYWDYLGWHDTMASPAFTARQYAYRNALGSSNVYTPQAVLNGRRDVNGSDHAAIMSHLSSMAAAGQGLAVPVSMNMNDPAKLVIDVGAGTKPANPVHLVLVYFEPRENVDITRGENRGRTIAYYNAVRDVDTIGMWEGKAVHVEIPTSELAEKKAGGCAVLLQEMLPGDRPGAILGAALLADGKS